MYYSKDNPTEKDPNYINKLTMHVIQKPGKQYLKWQEILRCLSFLPCKALKAVAAQAGFVKSTKQRTIGSPFRCIAHKYEPISRFIKVITFYDKRFSAISKLLK